MAEQKVVHNSDDNNGGDCIDNNTNVKTEPFKHGEDGSVTGKVCACVVKSVIFPVVNQQAR